MMSSQHVADRPSAPTTASRRDMTTGSLPAFFGLTFALGWGLAALMLVFRRQVETIFGPIGYTNPFFILVVYSPAMAGIALVWRHYGVRGVGSMLRRATLWRMPGGWGLAPIVGIPAAEDAGGALNGPGATFGFSPRDGGLPPVPAP